MVLFINVLQRLASVFALAILTASAASASDPCDVPNHGANRVAISPVQVAGRYVLDKKASRMEFRVSHFPFSEVRGTFADFEGGFVIPPTALERSHVDVVLEPASVDTRSKIVDRMVTGEEFFDVQRYPEIRFVSAGIQLTGNGKARLTGELTLLGVTRPASFDVGYAFEEFDPKTPEREMTFCATSKISRSEFGMEGLPGVVSDKITLRVRGVGRRIATIADVSREWPGLSAVPLLPPPVTPTAGAELVAPTRTPWRRPDTRKATSGRRRTPIRVGRARRHRRLARTRRRSPALARRAGRPSLAPFDGSTADRQLYAF